MESVKIMSRNKHQHEENEKNPTTRLPSPIRRTVADHVKYGLTENQTTKLLVINYSQVSIEEVKLHSVILYERRKHRLEIYSVYDLRKWCYERKESKDLHSTFVPFYTVDNINNWFVFFHNETIVSTNSINDIPTSGRNL